MGLTSAEVLLICSETWCTMAGPGGLMDSLAAGNHRCVLRLACWHSRDRGDGVRQRHLLALFTDIDDGALGEAEVSTKVVDTLHPSFAGIM